MTKAGAPFHLSTSGLVERSTIDLNTAHDCYYWRQRQRRNVSERLQCPPSATTLYHRASLFIGFLVFSRVY